MMTEEDLQHLRDYYAQQEAPETQVNHSLNLYVLPFIVAIGTVGNILSSIVLYRLMNKMVSMYCYLAIGAVIEMILLWIKGGNEWIIALQDEDWSTTLMARYATMCKLYPTLVSFLEQFSVWMIVCVAIEGALVAKNPRAIITICTLKRAKAVITVLIVVLFCPNVHFFWTYEIVPSDKKDPNSEFCTVAKYGKGHYMTEEFVTLVWPVIDILIGKIIPFLAVLVCFITILTHPIKKHAKLNGSTRGQSLIMTNLLESRRVNLAICLSFLILSFPLLVYTSYTSVNNFEQLPEGTEEMGNSDVRNKEILAQTITMMWFQLFQSIKVFLLSAMSHDFRHRLKSAVTCCCRRWKVWQRRRKQMKQDKVQCIPSTSSDNYTNIT